MDSIRGDGAATTDQFMEQFRRSYGRKGSESFVPVTNPLTMIAFTDLVEAIMEHDPSTAMQQIQRLDELGVRYKLMQLVGSEDAPVYGVVERVGPGDPEYRGWGAFLLRPARGCNKIYGAPHVRSDQYTEEITLLAFTNDPLACAALFAGTSRYANSDQELSADVAHTTDNVFHTLTAYLAERGKRSGAPPWVIQFHGSGDRTDEPEVVGANGARRPALGPDSALVAISESVNRAGHISMGVCGWQDRFERDRTRAYRLCATGNVQGQLLEQLGMRRQFMHFEITNHVRADFHRRRGPGWHGVESLLAAIREATS